MEEELAGAEAQEVERGRTRERSTKDRWRGWERRGSSCGGGEEGGGLTASWPAMWWPSWRRPSGGQIEVVHVKVWTSCHMSTVVTHHSSSPLWSSRRIT